MLPLRFTRIPGLFSHCSHGLRVPAPRYLSQTAVRKARRRGGPVNRLPVSPSTLQSDQDHKKGGEDDDQMTVNYFEKEELGGESKILPSDHPDSDISALEQFDRDLEKEIENVNKRLKEPELDGKSPKSLLRSLFTDEQFEKAQQHFANLATQDTIVIPHQIKSDEELSESSRIFLDRLNEALDAASLRPRDEKVRRTLWRYYERSKIYIPNLLSLIPQDAWSILWTAISENSISNPNRMSHMRILSDDMVQAGRELTQEQRFARVEGLFVDEEQSAALRLWEAGIQNGDAGNPQYLEMGIRMYCRAGNIKRAEELLFSLFNLYKTWNPRILIPVMMACLNQGTKEGIEEAFALYMRLRDRLSTDFTMEDYDQISVGFLRAGQRDYALSVFRDMMLTGDPQASNYIAYGTVVARMGSFMSLSKDVQTVNSLNLDSLSFLPRRFQNKFFYASWMKKLIGMGQIDDAALIVELMYERGLKPDAKHINGLIGGWLRSGDKSSQMRAEKTAWAMVQARLDFVRERRSRRMSSELDMPRKSVHDDTEGAQLPLLDERPTPRATVETFSVLVQWYLRRGMFENVRHLRNLLVAAEIPMNSYFMNHLLYAELRNRTHREVWTRFQVMSRTVTPDVETFACLWECMKSHVDPARNEDPSGYPAPRQLLARMRSWFNGLTGQNLRDARGDVDIDLYNDIIHSFCLARDLEGSFVALVALKADWGLYPEPNTIRMLMMQIARLTAPLPRNLGKPSHRKSRKITASRENQQQIAHVLQGLDLITRDRRAEMKARGVNFEDLSPEKQGEENHRVVLQLLYSVMMELHGAEFDGAGTIAGIAAELGIERLDVEDAMALQL